MPKPDLALQGNLFGDAEPARSAPIKGQKTEAELDQLDDLALTQDAKQRPRQRQLQRQGQPQDSQLEQSSQAASSQIEQSSDHDANSDDDLPPWSHHSQVTPEQLTPMLRHYVELKAAHPERVLLYRLGDFFECFFEDAIHLSRLLELTLTGKEAGKQIGRVPMAGIPHHAAARYCSELIRRGLSVALCDQLEAAPASGALLKRDITRVLAPSKVPEEGMLGACCR